MASPLVLRPRTAGIAAGALALALGASGCSVEIMRPAPAGYAAGGCKACATQEGRRVLPALTKAAADLPGGDDPAALPGDGAAKGTPAVLTSIVPVSASAPEEGRPPAAPPAPEPGKPPDVVKLPEAAKLPNLAKVPEVANAVQVVNAVQPAPAADGAAAKPRRKKKRPAAERRPVLGFDASAAEPAAAAPPTLLAPEFAGHAAARAFRFSEPSPVTSSYPAVAANPVVALQNVGPARQLLFPLVMSLNANLYVEASLAR